jgi:hypothetical protein
MIAAGQGSKAGLFDGAGPLVIRAPRCPAHWQSVAPCAHAARPGPAAAGLTAAAAWPAGAAAAAVRRAP